MLKFTSLKIYGGSYYTSCTIFPSQWLQRWRRQAFRLFSGILSGHCRKFRSLALRTSRFGRELDIALSSDESPLPPLAPHPHNTQPRRPSCGTSIPKKRWRSQKVVRTVSFIFFLAIRKNEQPYQHSTPYSSPPLTAHFSLPVVKVHIKTRNVTVEGPRGKLTKNLGHLAVSFSCPEKSVLHIEMHHGSRKNVATLRTVRTLINNMIIGVTKGFKYKMRYVYAHFPINVALEKNKETGLWEVEIRCVILFLVFSSLVFEIFP